MTNINFISKRIVLYFHEQLIQIYGGTSGIRDENLLDSALAQPRLSHEGSYLHDSLFEMAAAYGEISKKELCEWLEENSDETD